MMTDAIVRHLPVTRPARMRSRAVMLLIVLLTLALAVAVVTPLATLSGVEAVTAAHRAANLRHRLAAESVIAVLPQLLKHDHALTRDLERFNQSDISLEVGPVRVTVLLQDDTAKLPLPLLFESRRGGVPDALSALQAGLPLPALEILPAESGPGNPERAGLRRTGCLDDLFVMPTDAALFSTPDSPRAWARYVTPLGNAVHAYRADPAVLEAALTGLQPGLGQRLARAREGQAGQTVDELLAALELPAPVAREARRRLTGQTERYSLLIRTEIDRDVRQRYVICGAGAPPQVLVNWEVTP